MATTVLVCRVAQDPDGARIARLLTEDERDELGARTRGWARARARTARALLRLELSRRLGVDPRAVPLARAALGKPYLCADASIHFNVAHSGTRVVVAVSAHGPVGVDVEWRARATRVQALSAHYFGAQEHAALSGLAPPARTYRFFQLWTLKEAATKALGESLWHTLSDIEVTGLDEHEPRLRLAGRAAVRAPMAWCHLDLGEGYSLAVAQLNTVPGAAPTVYEARLDGGRAVIQRPVDLAGHHPGASG